MQRNEETLKEIFQKINFKMFPKDVDGEPMKGQFKIVNIISIPDMDYRKFTFDVIINFGSNATYESLNTPDFQREFNKKFVTVKDNLSKLSRGILTKTLENTLKDLFKREE